MSSDLSQLISQLLRTENGQNPQILSVNGSANQTPQPNAGALSSDGPNVSQRIQVANSNIHQVNYSFHFIGNPNLGASAIANGDHGAYPNHQDSTAISYASQSTIETAKFIGSNSVQNVQPSGHSTDQVNSDFSAKLAAVKKSAAEVEKSTAELEGSTVELAEVTDKLSESVTALNCSTFKLGVVSGPASAELDSTVQFCMTIISFSRSIINFGRLSVSRGESIVQNSDSMTTVAKSISLVVFDTSTVDLGDTAARYKQACTDYLGSLASFGDSKWLYDCSHTLEESTLGRLKGVFGPVVELDAIGKIAGKLGKSTNTFDKSLAAFGASVIAYRKSIAALDDLLAAFNRQNQ